MGIDEVVLVHSFFETGEIFTVRVCCVGRNIKEGRITLNLLAIAVNMAGCASVRSRGACNRTPTPKAHNKERDTMNKAGIVTALVVGVTLVVGGLVWSSGKERKTGEENKQLVGMAMAATVQSPVR